MKATIKTIIKLKVVSMNAVKKNQGLEIIAI